MPHKGQPQLYVMRCGRMYKIGHAENPEQRRKDLSTGSAYPITLWLVFPCENARRAEVWLHRMADMYRGKGGREWFELPPAFTGWLAKQTGDSLDAISRKNAACWRCQAQRPRDCTCTVTELTETPRTSRPRHSTPQREEFLRCEHCGRWFGYRGRLDESYCYDCRPLAARYNLILLQE